MIDRSPRFEDREGARGRGARRGDHLAAAGRPSDPAAQRAIRRCAGARSLMLAPREGSRSPTSFGRSHARTRAGYTDLGRRQSLDDPITFPAKVGVWTREHVGAGGGSTLVTEFVDHSWSIVFMPTNGTPIVAPHNGPLKAALQRADEFVRRVGPHSCSQCPPW
jgi:hypothetical protein